MTHTFPHGERVTRGQCHWEHTPDADKGLNELLARDPFAYGNLIGQIEESERGGLGRSRYRQPQDYRCPLDYAPKDEPDPPWLGKLKASGIGRKTEWRLYFGEPVNRQDHVVGVTLRDSKLGRLNPLQNHDRQRRDIKQAMRYLRKFFTERGYLWAPFPKR
ncbi:hypothetical protein [Nocardia flavorosea]|uniref:hypothetical protein n=1 Tax=Nocardia flavorosea TaxID=53429 RepID=UPI002458D1DE|nr:hypothetical protein [Nocardia flavorosea]